MASNIPKHGDAIIEVKADGFGAKKLVASFQFQRFLDELGVISDNIDAGEIDQIVASISLKVASLLSEIDNQKGVISNLTQENTALNIKNALLLSKVDNQEHNMLDLEQLLYVNKG